jgi:hypothetical protein
MMMSLLCLILKKEFSQQILFYSASVYRNSAASGQIRSSMPEREFLVVKCQLFFVSIPQSCSSRWRMSGSISSRNAAFSHDPAAIWLLNPMNFQHPLWMPPLLKVQWWANSIAAAAPPMECVIYDVDEALPLPNASQQKPTNKEERKLQIILIS